MRLDLPNCMWNAITRCVGVLLCLLVGVQLKAAPTDVPKEPVTSSVVSSTNNPCGLLPPVLTPSATTVTAGSGPVSITATGCPGGIIQYFGSVGVYTVAPGGVITVPTNTTGTMLISALCSFSGCTSDPATATVQINPSTAPNLTPIVSNTIASQTGTVGTNLFFQIPANTFSDPTNDPLVLTAAGLPNGLFFNGSLIVGPLLTPGTSPITITATNSYGYSASTTFPLVVTGPTTLTVTSFTCNTSNSVLNSVNFVVGYSNGQFTPALPNLFINGVTNTGQLGQTFFLPVDANSAPVAVQDNATRTTYFTWDYRAACAAPVSPTPPVAPMLPNQTAVQGTPFSYVVPAFTGTAPISYSATGLPTGLTFNAGTRTISGTASTTGVSTVTISASNTAGMSNGTFTITVSASATQPATLTITSFTCNTTNSVLTSVNFVVGYTNGLFTPAVPNLLIIGVTNTGQLGQTFFFPFDANSAPVAVQDNATGSTYFVWNYRAACASQLTPNNLRAVPDAAIQLGVMGNPVSDVVDVEINGAEGGSLNLMLTDMQGNVISQQQIDQAAPKQQVRLNVSQQPTGVMFLRATTPSGSQGIRVLKVK